MPTARAAFHQDAPSGPIHIHIHPLWTPAAGLFFGGCCSPPAPLAMAAPTTVQDGTHHVRPISSRGSFQAYAINRSSYSGFL